MRTRKHTQLVRESDFVAEVEIELVHDDGPGSPHMSLDDAQKLTDVRLALRKGDLESARRLARVFRLVPLAAAS